METEVTEEKGSGKRMSLGAHLIELRKRLLISAAAIIVGMVAGWYLSDWVWEMLRQPVNDIRLQGRDAVIAYGDITGGFDLKLRVAFFISILIASPIWLYQVWAFLAPGLTRREKLYGVGFLSAAVPLFLGGAYAGWLVLPNIVRLMAGFQSSEEAFFLDARGYLDFTTRLLVAVGIGFVMPVLLVLLNFLGVIRGRSILKSWRVAIMIIVLFAALATPAVDLMSMFLLAAPMVLLFFTAVGIALWHDRLADKKQAKEFAEYGLDETGDAA